MSEAVSIGARVLLYIGAIGLLGRAVVSWVAPREVSATPRWMLLSLLLAVVLLFVAQFVALELTLTRTDVAMLVRQTSWGHGWMMLAVSTIAACVVNLGSSNTAERRALRTITAVSVAISMSGIGHAAADDAVVFARVTDSLHVLGVGAWIGGLFAMRQVDDVSLWRRFSALASISLSLVLASGAVATWRRLGAQTLTGIVQSDYGQLLALKVALVAVVIAFGYASRRRIQRDAVPVAQTLRSEFAFALTVLIATAWLTGTAPPGE